MAMEALVFSKDYAVWHYGRALRDFLGISRDLVSFLYHFFSIPTLTRTFFSPYARIRAGGISITDIEGSAQNIVLDIVARIVGMYLRAAVIALGICAEIALAILLAAAWAVWISLPAIIIWLAIAAAGAVTP